VTRATARDRYLRRRYGISEEDYELLCGANDGRCWICGAKPKGRRLHLDHDHKTRRPRGVLCWFCNSGLARFRDHPYILRRAADYLEGDDADRILRKDTDARVREHPTGAHRR